MTLGQRIKQLRIEKELNQPELAQAIGIEQSYLSKLENDKAFPSDEMFEKLLKTLSISVEIFLSTFDDAAIDNQLMKLSIINNKKQSMNKYSARYMLNWIFSTALMAIIGVTLFLSGENKWVFNESRQLEYYYQSMGIIKEGESLLLFESNVHRMKNETLNRVLPDKFVSVEKNGDFFVKNVPGGTRYYKYTGASPKVYNTPNNLLRVIGVFLGLLGFIGLLIEPKVRRIKYSRL